MLLQIVFSAIVVGKALASPLLVLPQPTNDSGPVPPPVLAGHAKAVLFDDNGKPVPWAHTSENPYLSKDPATIKQALENVEGKPGTGSPLMNKNDKTSQVDGKASGSTKRNDTPYLPNRSASYSDNYGAPAQRSMSQAEGKPGPEIPPTRRNVKAVQAQDAIPRVAQTGDDQPSIYFDNVSPETGH